MKFRTVLAALVLCLLAAGLAAQTPPPVPQNLTVQGVPGPVLTAKLLWEAPPGPWGFRVYRSPDDTGHFHVIGTTPSRMFSDNHLVPGHTYYYYVTSFTGNPGGTIESPPSNRVMFTAVAPPPPARGAIGGRVSDDATGLGINHAKVSFYRIPSPTVAVRYVFTDTLGMYHALLDTGTYIIKAEAGGNHPGTPGYVPEWFDNQPTPQTANRVAVAESTLFVADFGLSRPVPPPPPVRGFITGTVVDDSTLLPIRHAAIRFFRQLAPSTWGPCVFTDSLGEYRAALDTGTYLIKAEAMSPHPGIPGYRPEWFDNAPDPSTATPVVVAESSLFVADFGLSRPAPPTFAFISGTVTDTLGVPLRNAEVSILRTMQELNSLYALTGERPGMGPEAGQIESVGHTHGIVWRGRTDSLGRYQARVVDGKSYLAMASRMGYLPEYYDNKTNPADADIIVVNGDVPNINFSLAVHVVVPTSIAGRVRDSLGTGVPARILLFPLRNSPHPGPIGVRFGHTDSTGAYLIGNVRPGKYFVLAMPFSAYAPAFYKAGAYGVSHWQEADTVEASGDVTGIDVGVVPIMSGGIARIRGRITTSGGTALAGVSVLAFQGGALVAFTVTDASGAYMLESVPVGSILLAVDREGYNAAETGVTVPPATYTVENVQISMSPSVVLEVGSGTTVPARYALGQNYPNPFNPSTTISFALPVAGWVSLAVYNLIGQEVALLADEVMPAGVHAVSWKADGLPSGVYFYRLAVNGFAETRKLVLMK
ncbi:MAG: carboxypeptidase regulatory-like domain-containing protein [Bacteroidota bacterium]